MSILEHNKYVRDEQEAIGSKFLLSNGYMGYRGTLDEADSSDFVALNLNGLYDGLRFIETVNVFNPLYTMVKADGIDLNPRSFRPAKHSISLNTENGVLKRSTKFSYRGAEILVKSERFIDQTNRTMLYNKFSFTSNTSVKVELYTGIDKNIWNISANHLLEIESIKEENLNISVCKTRFDEVDVVIGVREEKSFKAKEEPTKNGIRKFVLTLKPKEVYTIEKYVCVVHSEANAIRIVENNLADALEKGYKNLYKENQIFWQEAYNIASVDVYNNDEAKEIVDYAVFQLISHRPYSEYVSINTKGLSGQFDMGAVSWNTEIMLLPFYINTDPDSAKRMVKYRINSLPEAMKKAQALGYDGAFYAEKSGHHGVELSDSEIKNNIHINGSIVYGVAQYVERTKDYTILFDGGMEMLLECSRFYLSYATLSDNKKHYDYLSIRGLDNTHGDVDNEAYTNYIIKNCLDAMIKCVAFAKGVDKFKVRDMFEPKQYEQLISDIRGLRRKLYTKKENIEALIESYDKYFNLEDRNISTLKRVSFLEESHYKDIENTTYAHNQNVVNLLALFLEDFSTKVQKNNYDYYLRRTICPDTFTRTMFIILACAGEQNDEAYKQFEAMANLSPENERFFGNGLDMTLCGGIYLSMVYGFAGLRHHVYILSGEYNNTNNIRRLEFKVKIAKNVAEVKTKRNSVNISWDYNKIESEEDGDDTE